MRRLDFDAVAADAGAGGRRLRGRGGQAEREADRHADGDWFQSRVVHRLDPL